MIDSVIYEEIVETEENWYEPYEALLL
jgi:hypothetical protein